MRPFPARVEWVAKPPGPRRVLPSLGELSTFHFAQLGSVFVPMNKTKHTSPPMTRRLFCVAALALAGCATSAPVSNVPSAGSFAWFDLVTDDLDGSRDFYSGLFGWSFGQPDDTGYALVSSGDTVLGGVADVGAAELKQTGAQWVPVLKVTDVDASMSLATRSGGSVVLPPKDVSAGRFGTVRDNRDVLLTLYSGDAGFDQDQVGMPGEWLWIDLFTDNARASKDFYRSLVGFDTRVEDGLTVFVSGGQERGGLIEVPRRRFLPNWLPYVTVEDIDATVVKSLELGGGPLIVRGDAAIILDPQGGAIGIALDDE